MSRARMLLAATLAVVAFSAVLAARQRPTFKSSVDTVEVHVTVRGQDGELVRGLTKDDFELFDNGKRQEISVFSSDVQAISVALLIDRSGSVSRNAERITAAADAFVSQLRVADQAAVNTLSLECQPLTTDKRALTTMLHSPIQGDMGSPVWSGVDRTMTSLAGVSGRRAILLFSDGDDYGPIIAPPNQPPGLVMGPSGGPCHAWPNPSEASLSDASRRAQREGIMVYTVSVEGSVNANDGALRSIARGSGGERYRLKDESELVAAFTRIVDELHHQYLLGFTPQTLDDKVHELSVRVKRSGLSVRARESYVAMAHRPAPGGAAAVAPLTAAQIEQAVKAGSAGQKLQAACTAGGLFPRRPAENDVFSEVVIEGPTGRIMRAAREARTRRDAFTVADIPEDMRAPVVLVTSQLKRAQGAPPSLPVEDPLSPPPVITPPPTPTPTPSTPAAPFVPSAVTAVRLRSKLLSEVMIKPLPAPQARGFVAPPLASAGTRSDRFDLAAFQALPGPDVEVVVWSPSGVRVCNIAARERASIR